VSAHRQPTLRPSTSSTCPTGCAWKLKSLKLYIWSFRDRGAYHEAVTKRDCRSSAATLQARFLRLTARFNVRGGIYTTVVAERRQEAWAAPTAVLP